VRRAGVGVDNVDIEACSRRGILVCNAPYGRVDIALAGAIAESDPRIAGARRPGRASWVT
jgi:D-3-phosphoglycerate dehydrogenase